MTPEDLVLIGVSLSLPSSPTVYLRCPLSSQRDISWTELRHILMALF